MNVVSIYIIGYILTLVGHLIGKVTTEELDEIKQISIIASKLFITVLFAAIFYHTYMSLEFFIASIIIGLYILSEWKIEIIREFTHLLLFFITFFISYTQEIYWLFPLVLFPMIIENSFKKYSRKEFFYSLGFLLILYSIGIQLL